MSKGSELEVEPWNGVIDAYREFLPTVQPDLEIVSLQEGATPLRYAPKLSQMTGAEVYLKIEGQNPTGSFKDRGMTLAVSRARSEGSRVVICASTGNTSASAAAYAARAGMKCVVVVPHGNVALGKLAQALIFGAQVVQVDGGFDDALSLVRDLEGVEGVAIVNSINPDRIEGQTTGAYEIVDQLGCAPEYHFIPVGNAGNITAYWRGYRRYFDAGRCNRLPKMMGFQAAGAAPLVSGSPVAHPETVATAIRIGNPASWQGACAARDESQGVIGAVTDDDILRSYILLAKEESVFCEPASAASVAGLLRTKVDPHSKVICVLTGNGLKDPDTAVRQVPIPKDVVTSLEDVVRVVGL